MQSKYNKKNEIMFFQSASIYYILLFNFKCDCANILGIIPTASFSHQVAFINFWKYLSLKGHHVTVLTTDPQNDPALPNLKEIDLSIGYQFGEEKHNWSTANNQANPVNFLKLMLQLIYDVTDIYLSLPEVQNLINNKSLHFDVVMVEGIFAEWLVFGEVFNAPTIMLTSLDATVQIHKAFQNPVHPVLYPETYIPFTGELTFRERLISTILSWIFDHIKSNYYVIRQQNIHKYFKNISISVEDMMKKSSMLFISVSPILLPPRPLSPRTIIIGGETTINEPKPLPEDLQDFLDSAKEGVILFSLGTNAKIENFGENTIKGLIDMFRNMSYKILWKFSNKNGYTIPKNVKIVEWVPQQDILRHDNLKLFVTQGGIQSLEEAIYFEKPLVGIPIYGDQENNVKRLQKKGVLKMVKTKPKLDIIELQEAILKVISNQSYKENIGMLKRLNMDQPLGGMEKAIWWTEYVIRHKGNVEHFIHGPLNTIPFYQYYSIDVLVFLVLVFIILVAISFIIFRCFALGMSKLINRKYIRQKKRD